MRGRSFQGMRRVAATAAVSAILATGLIAVVAPQTALPEQGSVTTVEALYPCSTGSEPQITYESQAALTQDVASMKTELLELRHAIDYDAAHGGVSPSVHEWADGVAPGTFGGGRKP